MEVEAKVPYGTKYLFLSWNKRKKDEKLCWYIFIVSGTTKTKVEHGNKIAVVRRHNPELAVKTLVRLQGHLFGATRIHQLPEAKLNRIILQYWPEKLTKFSYLDWNQMVGLMLR